MINRFNWRDWRFELVWFFGHETADWIRIGRVWAIMLSVICNHNKSSNNKKESDAVLITWLNPCDLIGKGGKSGESSAPFAHQWQTGDFNQLIPPIQSGIWLRFLFFFLFPFFFFGCFFSLSLSLSLSLFYSLLPLWFCFISLGLVLFGCSGWCCYVEWSDAELEMSRGLMIVVIRKIVMSLRSFFLPLCLRLSFYCCCWCPWRHGVFCWATLYSASHSVLHRLIFEFIFSFTSLLLSLHPLPPLLHRGNSSCRAWNTKVVATQSARVAPWN